MNMSVFSKRTSSVLQLIFLTFVILYLVTVLQLGVSNSHVDSDNVKYMFPVQQCNKSGPETGHEVLLKILHDERYPVLKLMKHVVEIFHKVCNVKLTVIDPDLLNWMLGKNTIDLNDMAGLSLGLEGHLVSIVEILFYDVRKALQSNGISINIYKDVMPSIQHIGYTQPTIAKLLVAHYVVEDKQNDCFIDIVSVYNMGNFLYTGSLNTKAMHLHILEVSNMMFTESRAFSQYKSIEIQGMNSLSLWIPENVRLFLHDLSISLFIPCNYTQQTQYLKKSSTSQSFTNRNQIQHTHLLIEMTEFLKKKYKRFWLSDVTLLGWWRECRIIPQTYNADIGILASEFSMNDLIEMQDLTLFNDTKFSSWRGNEASICQVTFANKEVVRCNDCTTTHYGAMVHLHMYSPYTRKNEPGKLSTCIGGSDGSINRKAVIPSVKKLCSTEMYGYLFQVCI